MDTQCLPATDESINLAAGLLGQGRVLAFPTETVYGLGADARSEQAVLGIFRAKNRPADNPLIVHTHDMASAFALARDIPEEAYALAQAFWPGPLTLILRGGDSLAGAVTAGTGCIGVRVPDHPVAQKILQHCRFPVAAPSANISGRPSPTRAEHVFQDMNGVIPLILDGGACAQGMESTILDCSGEGTLLLRPGALSVEQIEDACRQKVLLPEGEHTPCPGTKYRHYAPQTSVSVLPGTIDQQSQLLSGILATTNPEKIALLCTTDFPLPEPAPGHVFARGTQENLTDLMHDYYALLRHCDGLSLNTICVQSFEPIAQGYTLMNRIHKSAGDGAYKNHPPARSGGGKIER